MILNINDSLIETIQDRLRSNGCTQTLQLLNAAIKKSASLEINYPNYGAKTAVEKRTPRQVARFVYFSPSSGLKNREIEIKEMQKGYITGVDLRDGGAIKKFRTDRIMSKVSIKTVK